MNPSIAKIKFRTLAILMTCLTSVSGESYIRRSGARSLNEKGCVLMIREDVPLEEVTLEEPFYECLLEDGTTTELLMDKDQKKEVETMIDNGDAMPGESVIQSLGAMVTEDGIMLPTGEPFLPPIEDTGRRNRRNLITKEGNTYFLVVRVIDKNGLAHPHDTTKMSDKMFGTDGDPVQIKSQIYDCSAGKLNIVPGYPDSATQQQKDAIDAATVNMGHPPGLMEATIDIDITNHIGKRSTVKNAVIQKVNSLLGFTLPGPFDHIVFNLERCYIDCGWAAYAAVNSWYMVYQGNYYLDTGTTVHEYGHNLGMAHSGGLNGGSYSDHTCQMGDPIYSDNNARMCFNPAKSYYIGWYDEGIELFDPAVEDQWTGTLMGVGQWKDHEAAYPVVVKIETGTKIDYFVGFNRAAGANSDNDEADDLVTIVETGNNGETYSQSWLKGYIGAGQSYIFTGWQEGTQDLVISVESIDIESNPGTATITISLVGTRSPTVAPTPIPGCTADTVMIDVTTDNYPEETSWIIENSQGVSQASSSPYNKVGAQDQYKGCHNVCGGTFTVKDSYGDGMCCSHGSGGYSLQVNGRTIIDGEGSYGSEERTHITCETPSPISASPTLAPTTASPTTTSPTTASPTTPAPTTTSPTTASPTTSAPTTPAPTTTSPTTASPTTPAPTTPAPTTASPTTASPTTPAPITISPTAASPTTLAPTTTSPTILAPTTPAPTITSPTTASPTTPVPNTTSPTTAPLTTISPTPKHSELPTDAPSQWGEVIFAEDFTGATNRFIGGKLNTNEKFSLTGSRSIRIVRKQSVKSKGIDVTGYSELKVDFSYFGTIGLESTDTFFFQYRFVRSGAWIAPEGGSWTNIKSEWSEGSVIFQTNGNSELFIRFRGDNEEGNDQVYFDKITISGKLASNLEPSLVPTSAPIDPVTSPDTLTQWDEVILNVDFEKTETSSVSFSGGKLMAVARFALTGTHSYMFRLKQKATSSGIDIAGYSDVKVDFFYYGFRMESTDTFFFEYSFDGSSSWTVPEGGSWTSVENTVWSAGSVTLQTNDNSEVFIRFRGNMNQGNDWIFLDDITVSGKLSP